MLLVKLIEGLQIQEFKGSVDIDVEGIACDSRKARNNGIFVCIDGYKVDGHNFIDNAIQNGAKVIFVQKDVKNYDNVTIIKVTDTRYALAYISNIFYGMPSKDLNMIGITGTKGKTTTTYMIKSILEKNKRKVGLIGTIMNKIGDCELPASRTTPESLDLQALLCDMKDQSVSDVVMEVSSHALELSRVEKVAFNIGAFTNLSQDHLDFHETFDNYLNAKIKLFSLCDMGVVNIDSEYGPKVVQKSKCKVYTYGIRNNADFVACNIKTYSDKVVFDVKSDIINESIEVNVPGIFSVYNALCAISITALMGIEPSAIKAGLSDVVVPGRAEIVEANDEYTVMIDYAHSPDSLKNILETVKGYKKGRLVSVFGCGGDRDKAKRPMMGEISGRLADFTIITSDNPRTEDPDVIVKEIEAGIKNITKEYITITDRKDAIKYAIENHKKNDIIVLAGKGHETYQIFKDKTIHFDEREVVRDIIKGEGAH
ncbi:MAG: UDP-N-acetylmuramoyl-L-alanyl-D-glutamate--2,6-diaminopimelate ligase [Clostridiales bacterium]|nr:UDP-N-acetylmuramoyl-L-alanyl-D-glutamate--2,6-diaminopimelate ligase [Clostridiales bacterium]